MDNIATVQTIYGAFGQGDIPTILSKLSEDVTWDHWYGGSSGADAGVTVLLPRTGRAGVGEFFASLINYEFNQFEPHAFLADGSRVAVLIRVDLTVKTTGVRFQDEEVHLWTFDEGGQVVAFRHFVDPGKHARAMQGV